MASTGQVSNVLFFFAVFFYIVLLVVRTIPFKLSYFSLFFVLK